MSKVKIVVQEDSEAKKIANALITLGFSYMNHREGIFNIDFESVDMAKYAEKLIKEETNAKAEYSIL